MAPSSAAACAALRLRTARSWDPVRDLLRPVGAIALATGFVFVARPPVRVPGVDVCRDPARAQAARAQLASASWRDGADRFDFAEGGGAVTTPTGSWSVEPAPPAAASQVAWHDPEGRHTVDIECVPFSGWQIDDYAATVFLDRDRRVWLRQAQTP